MRSSIDFRNVENSVRRPLLTLKAPSSIFKLGVCWIVAERYLTPTARLLSPVAEYERTTQQFHATTRQKNALGDFIAPRKCPRDSEGVRRVVIRFALFHLVSVVVASAAHLCSSLLAHEMSYYMKAIIAPKKFDPASEADKRSDPPAEGESVEAGGNGCED